MYCKQCGKQIDEDAKFCQFCGFELDKESNQANSFVAILKHIKSRYPLKNSITVYIIWLCIHFCLYLFGGQGYHYTPTWGRDIHNNPEDFLYPFGRHGMYFKPIYYDKSELILYLIILPIIFFAIRSLIQSRKRK